MQFDPMYQNGIYLSAEGKILRRWRCHHGITTQLPDSTYADELITALRHDYSEIDQRLEHIENVRETWENGDPREITLEETQFHLAIVLQGIDYVTADDPVIGELIYADLIDRIEMLDNTSPIYFFQQISAAEESLLEPMVAFLALDRKMKQSMEYSDLALWLEECVKTEPDFVNRRYQYEMVIENGGLTELYFFDNFRDYYYFVFLNFCTENRRVQFCEYCGQLFVPKTKRTTLYCDRVIPSVGKTCKQIAPKAIMQNRLRSDPLLAEYERAKNRNYKRVERTMLRKGAADGKCLTLAQYEAWFRVASEARRGYLSGDVGVEEFLEVIHELD